MAYKHLFTALILSTSLFSQERFYNVDSTLLIDSKLKVEWLMNFQETPSFSTAQNYCERVQKEDKIFRLPTLQELMSLVKYSKINANNFAFTGNFWSSSLDTSVENKEQIFTLSLPNGVFTTVEHNSTHNTLCISDINDTI